MNAYSHDVLMLLLSEPGRHAMQRFGHDKAYLFASTFFSSSLRKVSFLLPSMPGVFWNVLELFAKILVFIIVIPAFLPEMCRPAWNFSVFLRPICTMSDISFTSVSREPLQKFRVPSTGKSSNSSSSSSIAGG